MKLVLCLIFCLGAALARLEDWRWMEAGDPSFGQTLEEEKEFRSGRQFKYIYNGQITTGIPGTSKQHSGQRIQAHVTFVFKNFDTCLLKIDHIRVGKLNRHIQQYGNVAGPRKVMPFHVFDHIPLEPKHKRTLYLPIKFAYHGGVINNVIFDGREKPWSANIKRGILNLLQVNVEKKHLRTSVDIVDAVEDQLTNVYKPTENDAVFYRVMEETVEGECETLYTVTKPQHFKPYHREVMNVTKTINFEKCKKRPQVKYNFHFSEPCPACETKYNEDQKFLKSSTTAKYQLIGTPKHFMINDAHTESEYVFVPFNEEANAIVTYINQNLKLIKTGHVMHRVPVPHNPLKSDSDMVYTLDWDIEKERFQMEGDATALRKFLHHKTVNKVQLAKHLMHKLVNNMHEKVEEPATKHYVDLVHLIRTMSKPEIEQTHDVIYRGMMGVNRQFTHRQHKKARDLLHDIMGTAGTKPAVQHLVQKIKQRQIPIVKAVSAIKNLMSIQTPSKDIIQELLKLAESSVADRHYMLKQATWLTIGSLMNVLCANEEDQWAREAKEEVEKFCPKQLKEHYVKILIKKLHGTQKWENKLIYIKTLGNAGIDLSVFEIEKVIKNKNFNHQTLIRVEAVLALRQLHKIMPKKIQKVLMPTVANKMEPSVLRVAAAYIIMQTRPDRPILDQLAKLVHEEKNVQVASFIYSYMNSLANTTNPCEKKLATDLRLSLRKTHKIFTKVFGYSKYHRLPLHSRKQRVGVDLDFTTTFSDTTSIPRQIAATLHSNFLGFWNKYLVSFKFANEGLEKLLYRLYGSQGYFDEYESVYGDAYRNPLFNTGFDDIFGKIRTTTAYSHDAMKEPKAYLSMKLKNQDVGFVPIKKHALEALMMGERTWTMAALENKLRYGVHINYNKATMLDEITYKIPTTIGIPVAVKVKVPAVMNVQGIVKLAPHRGLGSLHVKAHLKPSLVAALVVDVEAWTPMITTGIKVVNKLKVFQPIDAKVLVDLKTQPKIVKLLIKTPTHRRNLITLESKPYTYTLVLPKQVNNWESKEKRLILGEEGNRKKTVNKCLGRQWFGVKLCVKGRYHKTTEQSEVGTPFAPLSGPNKIVITAEPTLNTPRHIAINLYTKLFKPLHGGQSSLFDTNIFGQNEYTFGQQKFLNFLAGGDQYDSILGGTYGYPKSHRHMESHINKPEFTPLYDNLMAETARTNDIPQTHLHPMLSHHKVKRPLMNSIRVEVDARQRHFTFDLAHVFNMDGDYHKVQMKVVRSPVPEYPQPWKLCVDSEVIFPTLHMIAKLRHQQTIGKALINWGRSCNSPNFIHIKKRIEKTPGHKLHELQNPEWKVFRDHQIFHDNLLNKSPLKYVYHIQYNNVPIRAKHYANEMLRTAKKHYKDHTYAAEIAVRNQPKKVKIIVAVDHITLKKADILVKTPRSTTLIKDVSLPKILRPITHKKDILKNDIKNLAKEIRVTPNNVQCYAHDYKIKTFHDRELPLIRSHSYKVLSKDCQTDRYVVLMRQLSDRKDLKEVKIEHEGHRVTLKPSIHKRGHVKVFVNGRDHTKKHDIVKTEAGFPVLRVIKEASHVKVELLKIGVTVYFNGDYVNVEVPPQLRHRQCGLCGGQSFESLLGEYPTLGNAFGGLGVYGKGLEIEKELFKAEQTSRDLLGAYPYESTDSLFRDYTNYDDIVGHYFNFRPSDVRYAQRDFEDSLREQNVLENTLQNPFKFNQMFDPYTRDTVGDLVDPMEDIVGASQLFNNPIVGGWENKLYPDVEGLNLEFNRFYTPIDELERDIVGRRLDYETPYETMVNIEELTDQSYLLNPYVRKNYFVNEESCSFRPRWEQEMYGYDDVFNYETLAGYGGVLENQDTVLDNVYGYNVKRDELKNEILNEEIGKEVLRENFVKSKIEKEIMREELYGNGIYGTNDIWNQDVLLGGAQDIFGAEELLTETTPYGGGYRDIVGSGIMEKQLEKQIFRENVLNEGGFGDEEIFGYPTTSLMTAGGFGGQSMIENEIMREEMVKEQLLTGQADLWAMEQDILAAETNLLKEPYETVFNRFETDNVYDQLSPQKFQRKHKIFETERAVCISTKPVQCPEATYPKHEVKKPVPYTCISRNDPRAYKFQNEILSGRRVLPELELLSQPTMTRIEVVPRKCEVAY